MALGLSPRSPTLLYVQVLSKKACRSVIRAALRCGGVVWGCNSSVVWVVGSTDKADCMSVSCGLQ